MLTQVDNNNYPLKEESKSVLDSINHVMYVWQNYAGLKQGKLLPKECYLVPEDEQIVHVAIMSLFTPTSIHRLPDCHTFRNIQILQDLRVIPDKESFRISPWSQNQGLAFVKFFNTDGTPYKGCPRYLLETAINELSQIGYSLKAGFEIEFVVIKKDSLQPLDNTAYYSLNSLTSNADDIDDLLERIEKAGIEIEQFHKEGAEGQFELVLKYDDIMKSIDKYYIAKEIISCFFKTKDYRISFLPKVIKDCGNGAHAHVSLWKGKNNAMGDNNGKYGLQDDANHFIAGILKHLNALLHFMSPSPNSLRRILPNSFCGAYRYWGRENREAPIKLVTPNRPGDVITNFELKSFDHTCNYYFAFSAIIMMGIKGIREKIWLPKPFDTNIADEKESDIKKLGIELLPMTWEDRKRAIYSDEGKPIREFIGEDLIANILAVNEADFQFFADKERDEEAKILIGRY